MLLPLVRVHKAFHAEIMVSGFVFEKKKKKICVLNSGNCRGGGHFSTSKWKNKTNSEKKSSGILSGTKPLIWKTWLSSKGALHIPYYLSWAKIIKPLHNSSKNTSKFLFSCDVKKFKDIPFQIKLIDIEIFKKKKKDLGFSTLTTWKKRTVYTYRRY